MQTSEILNWIFGGGMVALVVALVTLRATLRKANAEAAQAQAQAESARAAAESIRITNSESATRVLVENIVNPLKDELNATRRELQETKRELRLLRRAIDLANGCPHIDDMGACPVARGMRELTKSAERNGKARGGVGPGQPGGRLGDRDPPGGRKDGELEEREPQASGQGGDDPRDGGEADTAGSEPP